MSRRAVRLIIIGAVAAVMAVTLVALIVSGGEGTPQARPVDVQPAQFTDPANLSVPKLGIRESPLVNVGVDDKNNVVVPPVEQPQQLAWYENSVRPGQVGPSVYLGHVNGDGKDGAFVNLKTMAEGDQITVMSDDAKKHVYVVTRVITVGKDEFPTQDVYGDTPNPTIRLVTCGGPFNFAADSYEDNVIVFGELVA